MTDRHLHQDDHPEQQYLQMMRDLLAQTETRETRNDTNSVSLFGRQTRYDLSKGFPLVTTKKVNWHAIVVELLWFIRGETNIAYLHKHGVHIWDEWADDIGELGPVYGAQWRNSPGIYDGGFIPDDVDQLAQAIEGLKSNPNSRRHMIVSWLPSQIKDMALPPCHCLFQFYVGSDRKLSCQLYQRSADMFLGVPFNIASYALLTHIVAAMIGREPGEFIHTFGDYHLYGNQIEQAAIQVKRKPMPLCTLHMDGIGTSTTLKDLEESLPDRFYLKDYQSHGPLKAKVKK